MRIRTALIVAVIAAQFALVKGAEAQFPVAGPPVIRVGFGGGMSVPVGDVESALDNGINGQAFVLVNLGGLPLRFNIGYQKLNFKDALVASTLSTQILSGVGGIQMHLLPGPVRPYLMAGVGAFNVNTTTQGSASESDLKFGIDGGAGIKFTLGRLEGFIEGRVQNIYTDQGAIDFKTIKVVPVTLGILF